jgi:hypothetical protein
MDSGGAYGSKEIIFEIAQEAEGGYTAESIGESIFTQADSQDELRTDAPQQVQRCLSARFAGFDSTASGSVRSAGRRKKMPRERSDEAPVKHLCNYRHNSRHSTTLLFRHIRR